MVLKILIVIAFFAVTIAVGIGTRKRSQSVEGFVLGGRQVGPWMSAFAYGTSYFSAVIFVGYAGQFGWKYGLSATWVGLGNAFIGSLMAWWILGRRTRVMTQHIDAKTMPEFFGKRFDSKSLRIAAALIIFVFLIPYTASVYNGLSRLFGMAFAVPYEYCVVAMALLTCIYVVLGGYMATVVNDTVQGTIMIVSIIAVIVAVLNGHGGFTQAIISLSQVPNDVAATQGLEGAFVSFFGPDLINLIGVVILTSLGTWGLPQMVQKFYAIKSEKDIRTGAIVSTAFALVVAGGSYFLGGFGRLFSDMVTYGPTGAPVYDSIVPSMLSTLPDLLIGITVVLVLSASMSTLSSLVLTSSSTLTLDFLNVTRKEELSETSKVIWMRGLVIVFIVISAAIALFQYHSSVTFIAQLMGISWGALAGAFLGPFLYSLYSKRISRAAIWASFIWGVGFTTLNMFFGWIASPVNAGAIAMLVDLVLVPVVSIATPQMDVGIVERCFAGYQQQVLVPMKQAIGNDDTNPESMRYVRNDGGHAPSTKDVKRQ